MYGTPIVDHRLGWNGYIMRAGSIYKLRETVCNVIDPQNYVDLLVPGTGEWLEGIYRTRFTILKRRDDARGQKGR